MVSLLGRFSVGKDIRPTYAGSKSSTERLKRNIVHGTVTFKIFSQALIFYVGFVAIFEKLFILCLQPEF